MYQTFLVCKRFNCLATFLEIPHSQFNIRLSTSSGKSRCWLIANDCRWDGLSILGRFQPVTTGRKRPFPVSRDKHKLAHMPRCGSRSLHGVVTKRIGLTSHPSQYHIVACHVAVHRVPATDSRDIVKPLPSGPNESSHNSEFLRHHF